MASNTGLTGRPEAARFPRLLEPLVVEALDSARVVAVVGPRQAGKTTLVRQIATIRSMSYVTLDDDAVRAAAQADPYGFATSLAHPVAIDEIQRAPELMLAMKRIVDDEPAAGRFLVTGSADLRTIPSVADALPGRVDYLRLEPLSEREIARRPGSIVDSLLAGDPPPGGTFPGGRAVIAEAVVRGGFPEARERPDRSRARFFDGYVTAAVDRDLASASTLRTTGRLPDVLRLVATRSGAALEPYAFGRELGLDGPAVRNHLAALERLFLLHLVPAWSTNLGARVTRVPRGHLADSGLLSHLLAADAESFARDLTGELAGRLIVTFAVDEIIRQSRWAERPVRVSYYRDSQQREIDLVLEVGPKVVAVEIKASTSVGSRDARHLAFLRDRLGERFVQGVVVYTGEAVLPLGDRLHALPVTALWAEP